VARGRRWGTFAVVVLLVLVSAELALRLPQVRALLPPRTHYYHPVIAQRLDAIERLMSAHGRIDVLFIGSSIVMTNVSPELFDSAVGEERGRVVSFNAGLPGMWPAGVHLYLEHVWLPAARPRMVVQGIRYAELAATTHAKNETQVWTGRVEQAWRESDLLSRQYAAAAEKVYLLQYRGVLNGALERRRDGWVGESHEVDMGDLPRGYEPRRATFTDIAQWAEDLSNEGSCDANSCEVGFAALRRTIAAVHSAGGIYVLANVPEHMMRWRGRAAAERYRAYVDTLRTFAASEGVAFVDPSDGSPARFEHALYSDFSHMTAQGSRQFTQALARQMSPLIATTLRRGGNEWLAAK
jgi:hypothetical protein